MCIGVISIFVIFLSHHQFFYVSYLKDVMLDEVATFKHALSVRFH
jgi:hypothetical protein